MPEIPALQELPNKWAPYWDAHGTYNFDRAAPRTNVFSIDAPPLTASGTLHLGHVFSYTHTDLIARFQRMCGKSVFYPVAFDDNGLPTERRVERFFNVRCDPSLPTDFTDGSRVGRGAFLQLCNQLICDDEALFERTWRRLGLSVDWSLAYRTLDSRAVQISQRAFLDNLARDEAYRAVAPTLWDVTFGTAVAQAELDSREIAGAYHRLRFSGPDGDIEVDTTRPELLPACVALVAHPDDPRYQRLFGTTARTPLFHVTVPIHAHPLADPDKGTGIAMVCTFGDPTDIVWWRDLDLPTRAVLGRDGRFAAAAPSDVDATAYALIAGRRPSAARDIVVRLLRESDAIVGPERHITHEVAFYEKGDHPLEIVTAPQWYIRNGGRDPELRTELLRIGAELKWQPESMRNRFNDWVTGLRGDWLISRQRFLGVPIPVWYDDNDHILLPASLPVDPNTDCPPGYSPEQRDQPGGFRADPDVLDTWATSSLTTAIAAGGLADQVCPMDLHSQSHEIIRTWLFDSILRSYYETGAAPWRQVAISGWAVDTQHNKMGKSSGNALSPDSLFEQYGPDAIRYWAARARPGTDTTLDLGQFKIGRRLATKLLNASRFVLSFDASAGRPDEPLDLALLATLAGTIETATDAFAGYDYARALESIEALFWRFCDDYIELVKERAYSGGDSARATLRTALSVLQRLLAPFLPFAAEEAWSWWKSGSVHNAQWPSDVPTGGNPQVFLAASQLLGAIRRAKSDRRLSMRAPLEIVTITGPAATLTAADPATSDLQNAAHAEQLELHVGPDALSVVLT